MWKAAPDAAAAGCQHLMAAVHLAAGSRDPESCFLALFSAVIALPAEMCTSVFSCTWELMDVTREKWPRIDPLGTPH